MHKVNLIFFYLFPVCYTSTTSVTTRPVAVVASQSISIAKIFPQSSGTTTTVADSEVSASQSVQPPSSSVYIHRTLSSPGKFYILLCKILLSFLTTFYNIVKNVVIN